MEVSRKFPIPLTVPVLVVSALMALALAICSFSEPNAESPAASAPRCRNLSEQGCLV